MSTTDKFETIVFQQKKVHKMWISELTKLGHPPSRTATALVWELLLGYSDALREFDSAREDIYKTAYELAGLILAQYDESTLIDLYRDSLLDVIIDTGHTDESCQCHVIVRFANIISSAFSDARADVLKKTIRHRRAENLSQELRVAKSIQRYLLPKVIPDIPGFEFAGRLVPAQEVGGDYWSVKYWKDDGVVTLKLADISGHGIAAATLVAAVKFISGGYYKGAANPAEVMYQTNRVLAKETPYDVLVSMAYGWLWPETKKLTIVNAGHEPAFMCREDLCIDFYPTGPVLGISETEYGETEVQLQKDDVIFFGSDGLTEAGVTEQFGLLRLKELVIANSHLSADGLADKVIRTISEYAGQPHDDMSLVVVRVTA
ncbi:MAG: PP2C family protein-serine/threonine phosphatase [Armatimonadota bacterium]